MSAHLGLTLLEVLITLTILSIVTYLATIAFPVIREQEALRHARQIFTSSLRAAQTQALNEERSPDCLSEVGLNPLDEKRCSDVGIFLRGGELITFADTNDNNRYDVQDFQIQASTLPHPVTSPTEAYFLVEATPPNVTLWHNGAPVPAGNTVRVSLQTSRRSATLQISSYGVVESASK